MKKILLLPFVAVLGLVACHQTQYSQELTCYKQNDSVLYTYFIPEADGDNRIRISKNGTWIKANGNLVKWLSPSVRCEVDVTVSAAS